MPATPKRDKTANAAEAIAALGRCSTGWAGGANVNATNRGALADSAVQPERGYHLLPNEAPVRNVAANKNRRGPLVEPDRKKAKA